MNLIFRHTEVAGLQISLLPLTTVLTPSTHFGFFQQSFPFFLFFSEINNCEPNPCKNNFVCTDLIDDFMCSCQLGYTGKQCETNVDDCQDQPCLNNGTCHDLVNNYTCTCPQGFQGFNCEDDVDECIITLFKPRFM